MMDYSNCFNISSRLLELVSSSVTCLDLSICSSYAVSLIFQIRESILRYSLEAYRGFHSDSSLFIGGGSIYLSGFCSSTLLIREQDCSVPKRGREFSHRLFMCSFGHFVIKMAGH